MFKEIVEEATLKEGATELAVDPLSTWRASSPLLLKARIPDL